MVNWLFSVWQVGDRKIIGVGQVEFGMDRKCLM